MVKNQTRILKVLPHWEITCKKAKIKTLERIIIHH